VAALANCSSHPLSKSLSSYLPSPKRMEITGFKEKPGEGIEGFVDADLVKIGSYYFVSGQPDRRHGTTIFISFENKLIGFYLFKNQYRDNIPDMIKGLKNSYRISVLTGDNESEKENLQKMMGAGVPLKFYQKPADKLQYIQSLQQQGEKVMMIGDGLNDAGALKQSDIGIAVSEQTNNFTPASDAIIEAKRLPGLTGFIRLCKGNRKIIIASFIVSIIYNIIGLFFAVQGTLSPLVAAILMPSSSMGILLITFGSSNLLARRLKLR